MTVYGFSANCTGLIRNYIIGRSQVVTIRTRNSSHQAINCGLPKGSILGPVLYNLSNQDFSAYLNTNYYHKKGHIGMVQSRDQDLKSLKAGGRVAGT